MSAATVVLATLGVLIFAALLFAGLGNLARRRLRSLMAPVYPVSNTPTLKPGEEKKPGVLYVHMPDIRPWGHPNASPFSLKLETWLLMAKIPYVVIRGFDLKAAPKGKIPFIEMDGIKMGDSELIIQFLQTRFPDHQVVGDLTLTPEQLAQGHAFNRMVSEHTVACMGQSRNVDNIHDTLRAYTGLSGPLPLALKFIARLIRRGTAKKLANQGLGRHSAQEIYAIGCRDLKAIADFLGTKRFMLGDQPTSVDASVFAILASIMWIPVEFPMKTYAYKELPVLDQYLWRVRKAVWGETLEPWYTGGEAAVKMYERLGFEPGAV
ncbi:uncharacterized protein EV422DRAFT_67980 [Fimicolochytrium jonesii]|uniref:uncharacterized protein n=1 Tax=Fimicolochytrium jonesii TaxID=1396493 RepID=UPI0022FEA356|nr:uncharacterized protein EV422DRAFT_67980 [Fimicolochytrium jonesii]KAI8820367.1 hypothetical protein EV422DRAFT_67980 [Fimicolochytrium jonesii]